MRRRIASSSAIKVAELPRDEEDEGDGGGAEAAEERDLGRVGTFRVIIVHDASRNVKLKLLHSHDLFLYSIPHEQTVHIDGTTLP